jgi:hypothetical protein
VTVLQPLVRKRDHDCRRLLEAARFQWELSALHFPVPVQWVCGNVGRAQGSVRLPRRMPPRFPLRNEWMQKQNDSGSVRPEAIVDSKDIFAVPGLGQVIDRFRAAYPELSRDTIRRVLRLPPAIKGGPEPLQEA